MHRVMHGMQRPSRKSTQWVSSIRVSKKYGQGGGPPGYRAVSRHRREPLERLPSRAHDDMDDMEVTASSSPASSSPPSEPDAPEEEDPMPRPQAVRIRPWNL